MTAVIQLGRLGELVLTAPALQTLARASSGVVAVVQAPLLAIARQLAPSGVEVCAAPTGLLAEAFRAAESSPVDQARLFASVSEIAASAPLAGAGRVFNFTRHPVAEALAHALAPGGAWGSSLTTQGARGVRGFWALHPLVALAAQPHGRVHEADARRLLVEEALGLAPPAAHWAGHWRRPADAIVLVLDPGAARRPWPIDNWVALVHLAQNAGLRVLLAGRPDARDSAMDIGRRSPGPVQNLVGGVAPEDWPRLFTGARLVVGADAGPVFLASRMGVPVVMIVAGVHAGERGPTTPGDIAVQSLPVGAGGPEHVSAAVLWTAARELLVEPRCAAPAGATPRTITLVAHSVGPEDGLGGVVYAPPGKAPSGRALLTRALLSLLDGAAGRAPDAASLARALADEAPAARVQHATAIRDCQEQAEDALALAEQAAFVVDGGSRRRAVEMLQRLDALTRGVIRTALRAPVTAPLGHGLHNALVHLRPQESRRTPADLRGWIGRAAVALRFGREVLRRAGAP